MRPLTSRVTLFATCGLLASCAGEPVGLRPPPLIPAPVAPVTSQSLPPAGIPSTTRNELGGVSANAVAAGAASGQDLQAIPELSQSATGVVSGQGVTVGPNIEFGRNAVLGSWNVSAQNDTCALNLSLTTWTGGFRASTRKCTEETLVNIGAWNLGGKLLTLLDAQGGTIARLAASGPNRFDGTREADGGAISIFR